MRVEFSGAEVSVIVHLSWQIPRLDVHYVLQLSTSLYCMSSESWRGWSTIPSHQSEVSETVHLS